MERNEALNYLKELLKICNDMSPEAVSFEKSKTADSEGVTLRIKGTIQEVDRRAVREIAKKHSLSVAEEKGEVIIFRTK